MSASPDAAQGPAVTPEPQGPPDEAKNDAPQAPRAEWLSQGERGFIGVIRFMFWFATAFGRAPARFVIRFVAFWYALSDRAARTASRGWLETVHGRPVGFWDIYQHIQRFALVTLDRIFLLKGRLKGFNLTRTGHDYMVKLNEERCGAMLIGAHMGSFEVMRVDAADFDMPINIVGHFENARMINATLQSIDPDISARVIHIGDDPVGFAMGVRQKLEDGEMVAILADRVGLNEKYVKVDFMGKPAYFPTGPFLLASIFKCPVYLVFGLYFEPNRYETYAEPFAERLVLPRKNRQQALEEVVQRYADRVADYARKAPDNWFNFYDFWQPPPGAEDNDTTPRPSEDGKP